MPFGNSPMRPAASPSRRQQHSSTFQTPSSSSPSTSSSHSTDVFRSLVFDGSVPLCICLASEELPSGSDRSLESVYIQAPRISYLPLLISEIRRNLLDLVLDENESATLNEQDLWFDCEGEPLKWHWPIGLIHDFLRANHVQQQQASATHRSYFPAGSPSVSTSRSQPLRITLHLRNPPTDRLLMSPSLEACKTNFMNQLKEADYVRWGSVRRVTSLRRVDQDALWEGVVSGDFQKFWNVAAKLVPIPSNTSRPITSSPVLATTSTLDAGLKAPDASAMRNIPMRIYLPHGGPVIQELVPVNNPATMQPNTLQSVLQLHLPALFPPRQASGAHSMTSSFITHQKQLISKVIIQGIDVPLDAELGWCAACLAYPDGWLGVILVF